MRTKWPDVLIVDIEMPRMDGITFLKKIMAEHPTPVVVCSSLAEQGARATFEALAAGAVSIITKPKLGLKSFLEDSTSDIIQAVRSAARQCACAGRNRSPQSHRRRHAQCRLQPRTRPHHRSGHCHWHVNRRHTSARSRPHPPAGNQPWALLSSSTCRQCSPPCLPSVWTACARSKCAKHSTATASIPAAH